MGCALDICDAFDMRCGARGDLYPIEFVQQIYRACEAGISMNVKRIRRVGGCVFCVQSISTSSSFSSLRRIR